MDTVDTPSIEWKPITPLPDNLPAVQKFDYALLPAKLRPWGEDIATRMCCPPDYVGMTIMVSLGAIVGRKCGLRPRQYDDFTAIPNQWGIGIGRPGWMKSPAQEAAMAPIKRLNALEAERYEPEVRQYKQEKRLLQLRTEVIEKNIKAALAKDPHAPIDASTIELDDIPAPTPKRPSRPARRRGQSH